jgi:hypothetical protein
MARVEFPGCPKGILEEAGKHETIFRVAWKEAGRSKARRLVPIYNRRLGKVRSAHASSVVLSQKLTFGCAENRHGAAGFMSHVYDNSRKKALQCAFPEHDWDAKRFKIFAYDSQTSEELRTIVERQIAPQLQINSLEDWYRVSWSQFKTSGFSKFLARYGGMFEFLSAIYPEHSWDQTRFRLQKGKPSQRILKLSIEKLFPGHEILEEFVLPSANAPSSQRLPMQFDIGVPGLQLVFEFQGLQHYKDAYRYGQQSEAGTSDLDKAAACSRANYTLISVPHWWDHNSDSLANTIRQSRPDLFPGPIGDGAPIPPHSSP